MPWKTLLFAGVALLFRFLEEIVPLVSKSGGIVAAFERLLENVHWPLFWLVALWIVVSLFLYCVASEIVRAAGPGKVRALLFGDPATGLD